MRVAIKKIKMPSAGGEGRASQLSKLLKRVKSQGSLKSLKMPKIRLGKNVRY